MDATKGKQAGGDGVKLRTEVTNLQTQRRYTGQEVVSLCKQGRANFSGFDLIGADLCYTNFSHADFSGANLTGANLTGACLCEADFSGANLTDAELHGANLSGANLFAATLYGANFRYADFSGANLTDVKGLQTAHLSDVRLKLTKVDRVNKEILKAARREDELSMFKEQD